MSHRYLSSNLNLIRAFHLFVNHRRQKAKNGAADVIREFVTDAYDSSRFKRLIQNFRFSVINAQQVSRKWLEIRDARVEILSNYWDEISATMRVRKSASPKSPTRFVFWSLFQQVTGVVVDLQRRRRIKREMSSINSSKIISSKRGSSLSRLWMNTSRWVSFNPGFERSNLLVDWSRQKGACSQGDYLFINIFN